MRWSDAITGRSSRILGRALFVSGVVIVLASVPFAIADSAEVRDFLNPAGAIVVLVAVVWLGTGALIVSRQPGNWAGWIFSAIGLAFPVATFGQAYVVYGLKVSDGSLPLLGLAAWLAEYGLYAVALLPLLFLLFPDGHTPSPRWRLAVVGALGGTGLAFVGYVLRPEAYNSLRDYGIAYPNPFGVETFRGSAGGVITAGTLIALVSGLSAVVALRQRFKRSSGDERQQLRWLVFVASVAGVLLASMWLIVIAGELGWELPIFSILLVSFALTIALGVPLAYGVAIFKHRLYDLDVVIRKTVVFGLLAAFITLVYAAVVGGIGALVGTTSSTALSFAAAAVLAVAFQPVRDRARRFADRIVYGKRATPYEVLAEFSDRMSETYATEDVLPRMAHILASGTGGQIARVWLRVGGELRPAASTDDATPVPKTLLGDTLSEFPQAEHAVEVRHQGELLGALSVVMPAADPMNPAKDKLVRDLASQAGLVLRNVRLIEELRASRQRLVAAQDEERRKIERNLHDGAQQQLVALQVKLRLAEGLLDRDPVKGKDALAKLQADTGDALENLRDLARGIYPPLLADQGLAAALQAQARKSLVPTTVESDGVGRYTPEIEATVYFCALEALQNVAKYANATRATLLLSEGSGHLTFRIHDDGRGFETSSTGYGTGLQGMADRLDAIGGRLEVTSAIGSGTTVVGWLPAKELEPTR